MRVEAARFIRPLPAAPSWWEDTETNKPVRRDTVRIEELTLTGCCQRDGGRRPVNAARRHFARVIVDLWTAGQSCDFVTLEQTYRHSSLRLEGHRRSRVLELIERMLSAMKNVVSSHIKKWIHCQMFLSVLGCGRMFFRFMHPEIRCDCSQWTALARTPHPFLKKHPEDEFPAALQCQTPKEFCFRFWSIRRKLPDVSRVCICNLKSLKTLLLLGQKLITQTNYISTD